MTALPTQHTTLSVSWLGRNFRALAIHRGQVQGTWASDPIEGTQHFAALLEQAIARTGYGGETVSLVLAHPRLAHQFVDVPPAKGSALEKLLERTAQQQSRSLFPTKAAWSSQPAEATKGTPRFLLNLFPKVLLDELVAGARQAGCFLTSVLPTTAVLQNQLLELPTKDSQVVMLAADTGGTTTVLVGRSDGQVLLARTLPGTWSDKLPSLVLDLRRTMLFVNQQHGANVEALFLFGPGAAERVDEVQPQVGLPTRPSTTPYTDEYWGREAVRLQGRQSQNLISREQQMAPQRRRAAWVIGVAVCLLVGASAALAFRLDRLRKAEVRNLEALRSQSANLQVRHRQLQDLEAELARQRDLIDLVATKRTPSVPTWVLGYLSEVVPRELVVTNLLVRREDELWRLRLAGSIQTGATNAPATTLARSLAILTNQLATGPFHVQFHHPEEPKGSPVPKPGSAPPVVSAWLSKLNSVAPVESTADKGFFIEGIMQP